MGASVAEDEYLLEVSNMGLVVLSTVDPTGIAYLASQFVQPICGPTAYLGEIDDGTLYDALGLMTVDEAFEGSYGSWTKAGDGVVRLIFESTDKEDVTVVIHTGGEDYAEVDVGAGETVVWDSTVPELQDKNMYLDRWRPGLLGLPGSGGGSLLLWIPRAADGGHITMHRSSNIQIIARSSPQKAAAAAAFDMSEGRLQHLLQPIRDLSKNWNIDLASELEEYMDKLENLSIAFDPEDGASIDRDGDSVMNFAEAALLIQGTSVIYSRKVEYLHALVFQTLAHLSKQQDDKPQNQQNGEPIDGQDEEENDDAEAGAFNNPLPLYDELQEAKAAHITLKQVTQQDEETETDRRRKRKEARALNRSKNNMQASIALMGSLVPDERDHGETFKLMSCNLHATGVLLLDEASKKYLRPQQQAIGDQSLAFGETPGKQKGMWVAADGETPAMALNFDDMDASEDDGGDGNGLDEQPDYEYDGGDAMDQDVPVENTGDTAQEEGASAPEPLGRVTRSATAPPTDEKDPWAPLDAYDASTSVARPFRKGRSYPKVPAYKKKKAGVAALSNKESAVGMDDDAEQDGLSDPTFQERFFMGSDGPQWASWVWTETLSDNPLEKTCKRTFCKAPLLVKSCDALWQREAKWRSAMRRCEAREKQSAQAMLLREQAMEEEEAEGNDQMQALTLSTATARLDMAFRHDANGTNDEEDDDNGDDNAYDDGFDGGDWDQGNDMDDPMGSYEAAAAATGSSGGPLTYEEICRQHLASFMSGTEKYVRETDLSKQVSDWQEKLTPLLKQQDAHPAFDIHHYGREIIDRLEEEQKSTSLDKHSRATRKDKATNKRARLDPVPEDEEEIETVPFETLVGGKSPFEVCRLFLASLQLANNGNVALSHAHTTADHGKVPFKMQLLSTANAYEALQA
ncbi:hypothetical protein PRIC1_011612 [Phytophthora ramorum]